MARIGVSLHEGVLETAEAEARRRGVNRSELHAEALRELTTSRAIIDASIVAGYQQIPQEHDLDVEALVPVECDLGEYASGCD